MIVKLINISWNLIKLCVILDIECDLIDVKFIYVHLICASMYKRASLNSIFNSSFISKALINILLLINVFCIVVFL